MIAGTSHCALPRSPPSPALSWSSWVRRSAPLTTFSYPSCGSRLIPSSSASASRHWSPQPAQSTCPPQRTRRLRQREQQPLPPLRQALLSPRFCPRCIGCGLLRRTFPLQISWQRRSFRLGCSQSSCPRRTSSWPAATAQNTSCRIPLRRRVPTTPRRPPGVALTRLPALILDVCAAFTGLSR